MHYLPQYNLTCHDQLPMIVVDMQRPALTSILLSIRSNSMVSVKSKEEIEMRIEMRTINGEIEGLMATDQLKEGKGSAKKERKLKYRKT